MQKLLQTLHCQNTGRPPIWLMRQAGRYLPEYRALKGKRSLLEMFHDVETIVEVTKLPLKILDVDAAILFSDILTVLDGLNLSYDFKEGVGPVVLDSPSKIQLLEPKEIYPHIQKAIRVLKKECSLPLLGFAGAPFTVASYIDREAKKWLFRDPQSFEAVLDQITEATIAYLKCQIEAGVDAVQLFDSWANSLGIREFRKYSLAPMQKIISALDVPVIVFCRGSSFLTEELASIHPSAISVDWGGDLPALRPKIPRSIAVQGNLDPMLLYAPREKIRESVDRLLKGMDGDPGYIFNLGHGLLPDTPVDNVKFMIECVHGA